MLTAKWKDLRPGDVVRIKGVIYSIEGVSRSEYDLLDESGVSRTGQPRDLDASVEMIMQADPLVSACCETSGRTPMQVAQEVVRSVLGQGGAREGSLRGQQ